MAKRVFTRGPGEVTRSIRITKEMEEALARLAEEDGESINAYIGYALDQHLQLKAEEGAIPWPSDYKPQPTARRKA